VAWLLAPLLLFAWIALVARPIGRRLLDRHDDQAAVEKHHRVLDRLREIDGAAPSGHPSPTYRAPRPHVRILGAPDTEPPPPPEAPIPRTPVPRAPLTDRVPHFTEAPRRPRRPMSPRIRIAFAAGIAALAIVTAFVAVGMAQGSGSSHRNTAGTNPAHPRTTPTPSHSSLVPRSQPAVRLFGADPTTAGYAVTTAPAVVTLVAKGPCWLQVRLRDSNGSVMYQGTMAARAQQTFSDPEGVWLRLGNPGAVTLVVNGVSIDLPAAGHGSAPFDVLVRTATGSAAPAGGAGA
jgi:hypothetical protein